jgi:glycosyltransferase involved in cell wall biosynthesis
MNRISIVTICFNNLEDLKTTISHIDKQTLLPFEHIIIDGSTKSDIKDYLSSIKHPPYRSWISERDKGISDAWNKGIRKSTGDIIHLQNSGDYYYDNTILQRVTDIYENNPGINWSHGKYAQYKGGTWIYTGDPFEKSKLYRGFRTIGHPTMFVRREMYDRHGLFDVNLAICADFDFLCRISSEPFKFIDYPLVVFTPGGASNVLINTSMKEMEQVYTKYFGHSIRNKLWLRVRVPLLHYFTETGLGKFLFKLKNRSKIPARQLSPE